VSLFSNTITFRVPVASTSGPITVTSNGYQSNAVDLSEGWVEVYLPQVIQ